MFPIGSDSGMFSRQIPCGLTFLPAAMSGPAARARSRGGAASPPAYPPPAPASAATIRTRMSVPPAWRMPSMRGRSRSSTQRCMNAIPASSTSAPSRRERLAQLGPDGVPHGRPALRRPSHIRARSRIGGAPRPAGRSPIPPGTPPVAARRRPCPGELGLQAGEEIGHGVGPARPIPAGDAGHRLDDAPGDLLQRVGERPLLESIPEPRRARGAGAGAESLNARPSRARTSRSPPSTGMRACGRGGGGGRGQGRAACPGSGRGANHRRQPVDGRGGARPGDRRYPARGVAGGAGELTP